MLPALNIQPKFSALAIDVSPGQTPDRLAYTFSVLPSIQGLDDNAVIYNGIHQDKYESNPQYPNIIGHSQNAGSATKALNILREASGLEPDNLLNQSFASLLNGTSLKDAFTQMLEALAKTLISTGIPDLQVSDSARQKKQLFNVYTPLRDYDRYKKQQDTAGARASAEEQIWSLKPYTMPSIFSKPVLSFQSPVIEVTGQSELAPFPSDYRKEADVYREQLADLIQSKQLKLNPYTLEAAALYGVLSRMLPEDRPFSNDPYPQLPKFSLKEKMPKVTLAPGTANLERARLMAGEPNLFTSDSLHGILPRQEESVQDERRQALQTLGFNEGNEGLDGLGPAGMVKLLQHVFTELETGDTVTPTTLLNKLADIQAFPDHPINEYDEESRQKVTQDATLAKHALKQWLRDDILNLAIPAKTQESVYREYFSAMRNPAPDEKQKTLLDFISRVIGPSFDNHIGIRWRQQLYPERYKTSQAGTGPLYQRAFKQVAFQKLLKEASIPEIQEALAQGKPESSRFLEPIYQGLLQKGYSPDFAQEALKAFLFPNQP